MENLTLRVVALFAVVVAGQIGGSVMLALSAGFSKPGWTVACALTYLASFAALGTLIRQGAPLSMLMPLLAALVPLGTIAIAVAFLGEAASWTRIALLVLSCGVIGVASLF